MLSRLYIENIAVIEQAETELDSGLNVLTGETGAGKSIIIDSINAVLGARTSRELIRTGASKAFVSAQFDGISQKTLESVSEQGFEAEDGSLILSREIREDGKNLCRINSRPATVAQLRDIGKLLINIHGQHETTSLLSPLTHMGYLDAVAENGDILCEYAAAFSDYKRSCAKLKKLNSDEQEKARRADMLRYQIEELEAADITEGEYAELSARRDVFRNFETIASALSNAYTQLQGDEDTSGACSLVTDANDELDTASDVFVRAAELASRLRDVSYELNDIADTVRDELSSLEYDPAEHNEIEARLNKLEKLFKKYGDEAQALKYLEQARTELELIDNSDEIRAQLEIQCQQQLEHTKLLAARLSKSRSDAAARFCESVCRELAYLDMPSVTLEVDIRPCELSETGCDEVEFLLSTNVGEPAKPLAKIASGGELSRIMLAFKSVLADKDDIDTLIFDEIDTGISGKAAQKVASKLYSTSKGRQIICITHLAQIAARADCHLFIKKEVADGRTRTAVSQLDFNGRKQELARIIGGDNITDAVLMAAGEMLAQEQ